MEEQETYSFRRLLDAPKGCLSFHPTQSFLLHVFWECPSIQAAHTLLDGLAQCAAATARDTPCVVTYFFRVALNNNDLAHRMPICVRDHPRISKLLKKRDVGVPEAALRAELLKAGLQVELLDLNLDSVLPETLQTTPVFVELTELYLDEKGFMEHAGSRDYLDGYAVVMRPELVFSTPRTVRIGSPTAMLQEKILEPILKEEVASLPKGCLLWSPRSSEGPVVIMLSMDTPLEPDVASSVIPSSFREQCWTLVCFKHPLRDDVSSRVMCVFRPSAAILMDLAGVLPIVRAEAFAPGASASQVEGVRAMFLAARLENVSVNNSRCVGYVLHPRVAELIPI